MVLQHKDSEQPLRVTRKSCLHPKKKMKLSEMGLVKWLMMRGTEQPSPQAGIQPLCSVLAGADMALLPQTRGTAAGKRADGHLFNTRRFQSQG